MTPATLHALFMLRVSVFVVEQACAYQEIDAADAIAEHLVLRPAGENHAGAIAGCLRLLPPEGDGPNAPVRIGRIVVAPAWRGARLGDRLMIEAIDRAGQRYPGHPLLLSAQAHLQRFYARHGFSPVSPVYDEDGIAHVDMRRAAA
ncbi:GNAT family N-acetyltransferase [Stappia indica]|uniref:GNAT family N-acetyltransferase n=1 Tax=Stappia indica TaxID=538381 RepID=UPI001CD54186|nr:GNAT family N-acetyltransferase [Stappia indica]MCA1298918.1 GNAT family N-acetyltransferase [Stappia indica]